jgi:peroxiredoxin
VQGDTLPPFALPNAFGKEINSTSLLSEGPLLITFYRGEWCPFCNLALRSLQAHLPQFRAKNVTLVAISPELPNTSLTTKQKHDLQFEVLSDVGNAYAEKLGLLFQQPEELRPIFKGEGIDLKKSNGDDSFVVPVAATILVDGEGKVRNVYAEPDWTKRLETSEALEWVDRL